MGAPEKSPSIEIPKYCSKAVYIGFASRQDFLRKCRRKKANEGGLAEMLVGAMFRRDEDSAFAVQKEREGWALAQERHRGRGRGKGWWNGSNVPAAGGLDGGGGHGYNTVSANFERVEAQHV
jgi:hypothetical protein